jgi:DNA-binding NarL/FixJ family response regulator
MDSDEMISYNEVRVQSEAQSIAGEVWMARDRSEGDRLTPAFLRLQVDGQEVLLVKLSSDAKVQTQLTATEREIVALVCGGQTNTEIASLRGRSVRTVETQLSSIYRKLGISSRAELIRLSQESQLPVERHKRGPRET